MGRGAVKCPLAAVPNPTMPASAMAPPRVEGEERKLNIYLPRWCAEPCNSARGVWCEMGHLLSGMRLIDSLCVLCSFRFDGERTKKTPTSMMVLFSSLSGLNYSERRVSEPTVKRTGLWYTGKGNDPTRHVNFYASCPVVGEPLRAFPSLPACSSPVNVRMIMCACLPLERSPRLRCSILFWRRFSR